MLSSFSSSSFRQLTESTELLKDPVEMTGILLKLWHIPTERFFFFLSAQPHRFKIKGLCFLRTDAEQVLAEVKSCMSWTFASSLLMGRKERMKQRKKRNVLSLFVSDKCSQEQQSMKGKDEAGITDCGITTKPFHLSPGVVAPTFGNYCNSSSNEDESAERGSLQPAAGKKPVWRVKEINGENHWHHSLKVSYIFITLPNKHCPFDKINLIDCFT